MNYTVILRHAQSESNAGKFFDGNHISGNGLTEEGKKQAEYAGFLLRKIRFDYIFVSDYERARSTCNLVLDQNLHPTVEPTVLTELRERDFGQECEQLGTEANRIKHFGKDTYYSFVSDPYKRPPGGESFFDVVQRTKPFYTRIKDLMPNKNLLIVTHYWVVKSLLMLAHNYEIHNVTDFEPINAKPYILFN